MPSLVEVPLFPLPGVVHFPHTDLALHVFEPRYQRLVADLLERPADRRWIGMVTLETSEPRPGADAVSSFHPSGTAGRLMQVEPLEEGRSNILLRGDFRFEVERELQQPEPYRAASVVRVEEQPLSLGEPHVVDLLARLARSTARVAREAGDRFPVSAEAAEDLRGQNPEELINTLAANLDFPVHLKLRLLNEDPEARAQALNTILDGRVRTLDLLRPFRHLAESGALN